MARKNRNLAGFGEVAKINDNKNINDNVSANVNKNNNDNANDTNNNAVDINDNINKNINTNVNVNNNDDGTDFIDQVMEGNKKKSTPTLMGFYPEEDIAKTLNMLSKKGGRGTKTRIINEALRKLFNEKGLL